MEATAATVATVATEAMAAAAAFRMEAVSSWKMAPTEWRVPTHRSPAIRFLTARAVRVAQAGDGGMGGDGGPGVDDGSDGDDGNAGTDGGDGGFSVGAYPNVYGSIAGGETVVAESAGAVNALQNITTGSVLLATFTQGTDTEGPTNYTATVAWGDGEVDSTSQGPSPFRSSFKATRSKSTARIPTLPPARCWRSSA